MIRHSTESVGDADGRPEPRFADEVEGYYRAILRRLAWPGTAASRPLQTLGITSCYEGEGVSTVASQLAAAAAHGDGHRVLLVDGNLVRPSLDRRFGVHRRPGLAESLLGDRQVEDGIQTTPLTSLSLLPAGEPNGSVHQAYDSARLAPTVASLRAKFDLVVFDMPSIGGAGLGIGLARLLDGVLLVVESERVRWEVAQRTKQLLLRAEARLVGAVLNKRQHHVPNWLYRTL